MPKTQLRNDGLCQKYVFNAIYDRINQNPCLLICDAGLVSGISFHKPTCALCHKFFGALSNVILVFCQFGAVSGTGVSTIELPNSRAAHFQIIACALTRPVVHDDATVPWATLEMMPSKCLQNFPSRCLDVRYHKPSFTLRPTEWVSCWKENKYTEFGVRFIGYTWSINVYQEDCRGGHKFCVVGIYGTGGKSGLGMIEDGWELMHFV